MCLYIKESFVAEKPIIAYKIGVDNNGVFCSFYRGTIMPFNELYKDPRFNKDNIIHSDYITIKYNGYEWDSTTIADGFLHAYLPNASSLYSKHSINCSIYKVIIPKGSIGFYGKYHDICTNQMIILNPEKPLSYSEICKKYNLS